MLWNHFLNRGQVQNNLFQVNAQKEIDKAIGWIEKKDINSTYYRYPFQRDGTRLKLEPIKIERNSTISPPIGPSPITIAVSEKEVGTVKTGSDLLMWGNKVVDAIEWLFDMIEAP